MRKKKSPIIEAVRRTAHGLHKAGVMDQVTLRGFASVWDAIEETPQQAATMCGSFNFMQGQSASSALADPDPI